MVGANYEREMRNILRKDGWIVFRSAGSFVCDLIALKPQEHKLVEVKSLNGDTYRTSKDKEQFDLLNGFANQGFNVYYFVRWKGFKECKWSGWKLPLEPYPVFRRRDENHKLL